MTSVARTRAFGRGVSSLPERVRAPERRGDLLAE